MRVKTKPWILALFIVGLLLLLARVTLPYFVKNYVNRALNRIPEYRGHVEDVDLWLIRGAYKIKNFDLKKINANVPLPFFKAKEADLSVQWKELFKGRAVGEIFLDRPVLNFTASSRKKNEQMEMDDEWLAVVKDLFPLRINHFKISNGEVHYRDFETEPKVDVELSNVEISGKNFSNTRSPRDGMVASIVATALAEGKARLTVDSQIRPAETKPNFSLSASLEKLPVTSLNDFLSAYANVDASKGDISVYTEMRAAEGRISGYVKPLVHNLGIVSLEQDADNPFNLVWQALVDVVTEAFSNQTKDQFGAEVPFSGSFEDPETSTFRAIVSMLGNAFVEALKPGVGGKLELERSVAN